MRKLLTFGLAAALAACGGGGSDTPTGRIRGHKHPRSTSRFRAQRCPFSKGN